MKVLVAGWFSFPKMGASAGDLLCRDLVVEWLLRHGIEVDICTAAPFEGGIDWATTNPAGYQAVLFVCGPFGNGWPVTEFLAHFAGCRLIGINLTMMRDLDEWNPFHVLIERDSSLTVRPDLVFLSKPQRTTVAGLVLAHPQKEYGNRSRHEEANEALRALIARRNPAVVDIDTRLDKNQCGLRTAEHVDSLIARMDIILTTRLHGMVLAIRNGIPAVVIDPIAGGAKVTRQAQAIEWPYTFSVDSLEGPVLERAYDECLSVEAQRVLRDSASRARAKLADVESRIISATENTLERIRV